MQREKERIGRKGGRGVQEQASGDERYQRRNKQG